MNVHDNHYQDVIDMQYNYENLYMIYIYIYSHVHTFLIVHYSMLISHHSQFSIHVLYHPHFSFIKH